MKRVEQRARLPFLVAVTLVAVVVGVVSDFVWDGTTPSAADVVGGVVLSPVVITVGGGVVGHGLLRELFVLGGLSFWPLYALLAWRWLRFGNIAFLAAIGLWSVQGLLLIQHRVGLVMSA